MPELLSIPHVTTTPKPFGVNVEWKWPDAPHSCIQLELQYLHEDGRLVKERIHWPAIRYLISGLKAGERLQVRLRPVALDGSVRDWLASDWIEGISSADAGEMIEALTEEIRNSCALHGLEGGWFVDKTGKAYINEALIGDGKLSANYSVKMGANYGEKQHSASMAIGVEGEQPKVVFKADQFKVHGANGSHDPVPLKNERSSFQDERCQDQPFGGFPAARGTVTLGVSTMATEVMLSEHMRKAVIKAVRESDLFTALQANIDAQTASVAGLQRAMHEAATNAIKNALKPGGLLYNR